MFEANKRVLLHENSSIRFTQAYIHKHTCISLYIISIGDRESEAKRERPSTSKAYHITTPFLLHILIRIKAAIIPRSIIWFSEHWTLICRGKYCSKKTSFNSWKTFLSLPPLPSPPSTRRRFRNQKFLPAAPVYRHAFEFHHTRKFPDRYSWRWGWGMLDREGGGARDCVPIGGRRHWIMSGVGARRPNVIIPSLGETLEA